MELKRILARDSRSANEKAMQLYGDDVLIISTQRVGDQIELIVALDDAGQREVTLTNAAQEPTQAKFTAAEKEGVFAEIFGSAQRAGLVSAETTASASASPNVSPQPVERVYPPEEPASEAAKPAHATPRKPRPSRAKKPGSSKAASPDQASAKASVQACSVDLQQDVAQVLQQELARSREIVELLRQEVGILRKEFSLNRQLMPWQSGLQLSTEVKSLVDEWVLCGVPSGLRALLTESVAGCANAQEAATTLRRVLQGHLSAVPPATTPAGVHALVGPSGSGKTSMAVRLAHMHAQAGGAEKQVIVSFADGRPGAWAQLQMLSASVGIDVYRAKDMDTLKLLLDEWTDKTHVWIDTGAHPHFAPAHQLQACPKPIFLHAVLPMDASLTSMERCTSAAVNWHSLMITKAEEEASLWPWLQFQTQKPLPISWIAASDQIRQSAQAFDAENWVSQILSSMTSLQGLGAAEATPETVSAPVPNRRRSAARQKVAHAE